MWYIHTERKWDDEPLESMEVWTVTKTEGVPGWVTDGGYPGYGLTKAEAQFLADAANEKEASRRPVALVRTGAAMSEIVERVARAIVVGEGVNPDGVGLFTMQKYQRMAVAAIKAMLEPREAMIDAAAAAMYGKGWHGPEDKRPGETMKEVWRRYARAALSGAVEEALK